MTIFIDLISNVALLLALSILYSFLTRIWKRGEITGQIFGGLLFGGVAVAGMILPFHYGPGVIFDGRSIAVSMAGLFGGPVTAAIATLIAGAYRLGLGGTGALTGFAVIFTSAALGVGYHYLRRKNPDVTKLLYLFVFGVIVHISMLLWMLTLPWPLAFEVLDKISIPVMLIFPLGTVFLGTLLADQEGRNYAQDALRESEVRLAESNQLLSGVLEHTHMMAVFIDPRFNFIWVNRAYADTCNHEPSFFPGKNHFDLYPHEENQAIFQRVVDTGEPFFVAAKPFEFPDQPERGVTYWDWSLIPVKDGTGKVIGLVFTLVEVTERIRAEEALRKSEERFRLLAETSPDYIYQIDTEGKILYTSSAVEQVLGYKPQELIGKNFLKTVPPDAHSDTMKRFQIALSKKTTGIFENIHAKKSGEVVYTETHATTMIEDGKIVGVQGTTRDITERKRAEEALRESEEKYRTVLESNPDPVVVYDMEGRVIYLNPAFTRVFGWSLDEQIGKKIDNFVPEENWPETKMMINKVTVSGESFSGLETRRYTKEGDILDINISGSSHRDQEGNVAASIINLRDVTTQKRLEDQLQQTTKMEAIGTLAGGVAHEFNNALMGVMGNIELLKMELPEDERRAKYFEAMNDSGHRMSRLTDQLLAYSEGGKYNAKNLKLDDFTIETLPILQHDLSSEVRVETHFSKVSYIRADHAQMQMVLSAIVANSNEAIEDEGIIRITAENKDIDEDFTKQHPGLKPGDYVCLTIEDDGKGMDEETRDGIFEPFFTTKFQGRGMGMAAVYGIIKSHDGAITVDSEPGKGTVVRIYLPVVSPEIKQEIKAVKQAKVKIAMGEGTILVIEDEEPLVGLFREILERLGYRALLARTGKEAVELAKTFDGQIDLALLDVKLPDMDGGRVYPLIMEARPDLKVIVCSGYGIHSPVQDILDAGAEAFMQKPFHIAPFAEKLKEVLEGK